MRRSFVCWQTLALFHISSRSTATCDAQLLSAYEQAYGSWSIKLTKNTFARRRWHLRTNNEDTITNNTIQRKRSKRKREDSDLQLFFPELLQPPNRAGENQRDGEDSPERGNEKENGTQLQSRSGQSHYTTKSVRSVECMLNLERNGKFTLSLIEEDDNHNQKNILGTRHHEELLNPTFQIPSQPISHQPLSGEWYLTPNPYCVTDRQYDTLLLVSEPRIRRQSNSIERATVELRCKIWGRYSIGAVRRKIGLEHGRVRGRMTHGTVVIVKEELMSSESEGKKKLPTREVVGTFCGKTIVDLDPRADLYIADENMADDDNDDDDELDFGDNFDDFGVLRPIATEE